MSNSTAAAPAALKLRRILTPIDFSDPCCRAAECAEVLARHFASELILLHAVAPVVIPAATLEGLTYCGSADLAQRAALLETFMMEELRGVETRRVLVENDPAAAILECAGGRRCDLIVMPTHGYGALRRIVAGSVTAEVVRHAPCPVWTGCHFEKARRSFQTVLCAVDLARESRDVLAWAAGFAREFAAVLRIVHAIPISGVRSSAARRIADLQDDLGTDAPTDIETGEVPDAIVAAAQSARADLLIIGRGPRSYSIIRDALCPVVVV